MALWTGSEINVACLVDGVTLGAAALKNIDQHMPPNPVYNAATDYGVMHVEPIKP